jgi:2-deoxy-D-gluconate 3-dehydrogenase
VADLPQQVRALETVAEIENMGRRAGLSPLASVLSPTSLSKPHIPLISRPCPKLALEVREADWDKVLDIDLKGTFFCAQAIGRHMVEQRYGRVINITSQMGMVGYFNRSAYCSAKAGVVNLTRVLAVEWAKCGVTINTVAPTFLRTPLTEPMFKDKAFYDDVLSRIPMGRIGEIEDVVGAVVFLASGQPV